MKGYPFKMFASDQLLTTIGCLNWLPICLSPSGGGGTVSFWISDRYKVVAFDIDDDDAPELFLESPLVTGGGPMGGVDVFRGAMMPGGGTAIEPLLEMLAPELLLERIKKL